MNYSLWQDLLENPLSLMDLVYTAAWISVAITLFAGATMLLAWWHS